MNPENPEPHRTHTLETVLRITGSSRRKVMFYCRQGVVAPADNDGEWRFDEESLLRLRHIETLRQRHRMNWLAIRTIMGLLDEVEALREELRFRR